MRTRSKITLVTAAALLAVGLAGCSSAQTPTVTGTSTASQAPSPSASTPVATSTPAPTGGSGGNAAGECTTANLAGSYTNASGTAGSTYIDVVLTNKGSASCTIQGWPGVSIVGGGNGTQIGQAAAFDRTSAHGTVTLASGSSAKAQLQIVEAGNYDASKCVPEKGDGIRVYPPGQTASLFIALPNVTGCTSTSVSLLTVGAFS